MARLRHELSVIRELRFDNYFLAVWDVLQFARRRRIRYAGRGSAADSLVAYCLGITKVDPVAWGLLFERFMSLERVAPPDIDVDFQAERRDEVTQYAYGSLWRRTRRDGGHVQHLPGAQRGAGLGEGDWSRPRRH